MIGLYVDDALLFGKTQLCAKIVTKLQKEFELKDIGILRLGVPARFLGMELVRRLSEDGKPEIVMKQGRYATDLVRRFIPPVG
jgi:hypothetical protein